MKSFKPASTTARFVANSNQASHRPGVIRMGILRHPNEIAVRVDSFCGRLIRKKMLISHHWRCYPICLFKMWTTLINKRLSFTMLSRSRSGCQETETPVSSAAVSWAFICSCMSVVATGLRSHHLPGVSQTLCARWRWPFAPAPASIRGGPAAGCPRPVRPWCERTRLAPRRPFCEEWAGGEGDGRVVITRRPCCAVSCDHDQVSTTCPVPTGGRRVLWPSTPRSPIGGPMPRPMCRRRRWSVATCRTYFWVYGERGLSSRSIRSIRAVSRPALFRRASSWLVTFACYIRAASSSRARSLDPVSWVRKHMAAESFVNNGPLPKNDEKLFRPTSVKVLRAFCVKAWVRKWEALSRYPITSRSTCRASRNALFPSSVSGRSRWAAMGLRRASEPSRTAHGGGPMLEHRSLAEFKWEKHDWKFSVREVRRGRAHADAGQAIEM